MRWDWNSRSFSLVYRCWCSTIALLLSSICL
jgi:hypothetical protein